MFTRLLQALGWVTKDEREGRRIDYGSSLCVTGIRDKNDFLAHIIDLVPDGSVWSIEGIYDEQILAALAPYRTSDGITYLSPALDRNRVDSLAQAELFSFVEKQSHSPQSS